MAVLIGIVNVLLAVILGMQYRLNRERSFAGLGWWALGQTAVAAGLVVSAARAESGSGRAAIPLYQGLLVVGTALILVGLLRFMGRRERTGPLVALLVAFIAWSTFFTFVVDDIVVRSVIFYLVVAGLYVTMVWALVRHGLAAVRGTARATAAVFGLGAVVYLMLALVWVTRQPIDSGFSTTSPVTTIAYLISVSATVLWTFGLVAMVNQRLSADVTTEARNMHSVFVTGPDCAIISRLVDGRIDDVNEGFTTLTGFDRSEVIGRTTVDLGLWNDSVTREGFVRAVSEQGSVADYPMLLRRRDATTVDCIVAASTLTLDNEPYLISVIRDVTQQRRMEADLVHEATTDGLTGLPNRRHFLSVCQRELHRAGRSEGALSIAVIDVDHFKEINDQHGHAAGDAVLECLARTLESIVRDIDTCGRLGGDEFAVLLPDDDLDHAVMALERVRRELQDMPCVADGREVRITISAGVAEAMPGVDTVDAVMVRADGALYEAKERGRNRVVAEREGSPGSLTRPS